MQHMLHSRALTSLLGVELPVIQAPMAGAQDEELACAVADAGGLGSLPCALLSPLEASQQLTRFRQRSDAPINLNFFCHELPQVSPERRRAWYELLAPYYRELGIEAEPAAATPGRQPFDEAMCALVEELKPEVVSFHFGLPGAALLERVRASGAKLLSSATTVTEAKQLEARGVSAIIAQGVEAGGHRGMFLSRDVSAQVGTFALVPQIVDAVQIPVIAAGGISDARGAAAARALGASGVQVGTAYLRCPESRVSTLHRAALAAARDDSSHVTNLFTGRPARGLANRLLLELGPLSELVPEFPTAAAALAPLRAKAEAAGSSDFSSLWAGQAAALARDCSARELTLLLAAGFGAA
jgi:nitronate monooxygenase